MRPFVEESFESSQITIESIFEILNDRQCRLILGDTIESPKSVKELSTDLGISPITAYRKVHNLTKRKFFRVSAIINGHGKKVFRYQSRVKGINIIFGRSTGFEIIPNGVILDHSKNTVMPFVLTPNLGMMTGSGDLCHNMEV